MTPSRDISRLIEIMAALRTPVTGCPWDLAQNFASIAPYTLEEAYEVADAIARQDYADLQDELGDLLLQVVYHARMAEEDGLFAFGDVVEGVTRKMIRRHPHVFATEEAKTPADVNGLWARIKAQEKAEKAAHRARLAASAPPSGAPHAAQNIAASAAATMPPPRSILADVPLALPALTRAVKLQDKAAKVGFDWPSLAPVFDKMREELAELEEVALPHDPRGGAASPEGRASEVATRVATGSPTMRDRAALVEEFGDLLFVLANVARHLDINPEAALSAANDKFVRRFTHIETRLAEAGSAPERSSLQEMDALWDEAKALEKKR